MMACILVLLLTGCGEKLREGIICDKRFVPEHTEIVMFPVTHMINNLPYTTYIPLANHHPDSWEVEIRSFAPDDKGKYKTAVYQVSQEIYDNCEVGEIFEYDEEKEVFRISGTKGED